MRRIARTQMIFATVACLAVRACASKTSGRGNLGTVAGGPAPATATPGPTGPSTGGSVTGVTGGTGTGSTGGTGGGTGTTSGGATSGGTTSNSGAPLRVTAVVDP